MKKITKNFSLISLRKDQLWCESDLLALKKANNSCWSRVQKDLLELYNYKCAYCQTDLKRMMPTVEHYRPKSKNKYFWLAHEWTNFLPCCTICQKEKSDIFETENPPKYDPPLLVNGNLDYEKCRLDSEYLLSEQALILNPEFDDPFEHFDLNDKNGELLPKKDSKKAELTIKIIKLNRLQLQYSRKKTIDDFWEDFNNYYEFFLEKKNTQKESFELATQLSKKNCERKIRENVEYSFVWLYLLNNFEKILAEN
ncbi:MAG: hypothetical protein EAZ97_04935 [Bacteroidetes bacterium]|nr:MAG: hypothetical protein EAZ97_04935 [Bacteroidota bacterium]